jgi:hypothetical protein
MLSDTSSIFRPNATRIVQNIQDAELRNTVQTMTGKISRFSTALFKSFIRSNYGRQKFMQDILLLEKGVCDFICTALFEKIINTKYQSDLQNCA